MSKAVKGLSKIATLVPKKHKRLTEPETVEELCYRVNELENRVDKLSRNFALIDFALTNYTLAKYSELAAEMTSVIKKHDIKITSKVHKTASRRVIDGSPAKTGGAGKPRRRVKTVEN